MSSSRDAAAILGSESDPSRAYTREASPGAAVRRISSGQRSSPVGSSSELPKRTSSGRNTTAAANMKNYESTIRGIESLNFDNNDERVHY